METPPEPKCEHCKLEFRVEENRIYAISDFKDGEVYFHLDCWRRFWHKHLDCLPAKFFANRRDKSS